MFVDTESETETKIGNNLNGDGGVDGDPAIVT